VAEMAVAADPAFEPEIIVFACHYCAYAAADLAGSMRLQYPASIRMVKLPCTGKLEVIHLLRALEAGADGSTPPVAWRASATSSRATSGPASASTT